VTGSQRIGIIHPGEMGISVAASAQTSGQEVCWASEGRSAQTRERAAKFGLQDMQTLARLCATCPVIVSVCPPDAADAVAHQVLACSFAGLYLDANAVSPQRAIDMGQEMTAAGVAFVDGGIIGGPAWTPGATRLYLSGPRAGEMAACFAGGPLATEVIGAEAGKASALKMCYAAYTKGTTALLAAVLAAAERLGVRDNLYRQWDGDDADSAKRAEQRVRQAGAKAWRFVGEMDEISATFRGAGLPGEFHAAAAEIYRRLAAFGVAQGTTPFVDVLAALREGDASVPLHLVYLQSGAVLLPKKQYSQWRDIVAEYGNGVASLGPWNVEDVVRFFEQDEGLEDSGWPFSRSQIMAFVRSDAMVLDSASLRG